MRAAHAAQAEARAELAAQRAALRGGRRRRRARVAAVAHGAHVGRGRIRAAEHALQARQRHVGRRVAPGAVQRALQLGHLGRERGERRAPAPQHDARRGAPGGRRRAAPTGSFQPPPPLVGATPAPGSPGANGRSPDWPRRPLKLGGSVGPPLGLGAGVVELRAGRRRGGRRVEGDPAVGREVGLDPRVRVGVAHHVVLALAVVAAGAEARRDARGHPAHAQHERHHAGELLAVAGLGVEEEGRQRVGALRRVLVVGRARLHAVEDGLHEVVGRLGARA